MSLQIVAIWVAIVIIHALIVTLMFFAFVRVPRSMRREEQEQEQEDRMLAA